MKTCRTCLIEKPLSEFYTNGLQPSGKQKHKPRCIACEEEARKIFVALKREWIIQRFGDSCTICGYNKCFAALEFHHNDPAAKEYHPSNLVNNMSPVTTLEKELSKCIMVCSNCHREIHAEARTNLLC